jgi:outer membrane biosynthesis protein TonB
MQSFAGFLIAMMVFLLGCRGGTAQRAATPASGGTSRTAVRSSELPTIQEPKPAGYPVLDQESGPSVTVDLLIGTDGTVRNVTVVQAPAGVDVGPIKERVSAWRFRPAIRNGLPVEATIRIPVRVTKVAA